MTQIVFGQTVVCRICHGRGQHGLVSCPLCKGAGLVAPDENSSYRVGEALRDVAVEQVARGAEDGWWSAAIAAVEQVARSSDEFTTDEVWFVLDKAGTWAPREPRAMGAVLNAAAKRGWIKATDRVRASARAVNHARPQRIWRSTIRP